MICVNRYEESIRYLKELVENYPDHVGGWSQLATCYMQSNKTTLAKETFDLALGLNPNDTMTLQNYGKDIFLMCVVRIRTAS